MYPRINKCCLFFLGFTGFPLKKDQNGILSAFEMGLPKNNEHPNIQWFKMLWCVDDDVKSNFT
jgi:hypothetical protein